MKIKIISLFVIFAVTATSLSGCINIFNSDYTSEEILNKYNNIVSQYYESIFTRSQDLDPETSKYRYKYYIEYGEGDLLHYIYNTQTPNVFNVFREPTTEDIYSTGIYALTLRSANRIFLEKQERLLYQKLSWESTDLNRMGNILDDLDRALAEFEDAKFSLINYPTLEIDGGEFTTTTGRHNYNNLLEAYNNLIKQNVRFSRAFERGLSNSQFPKQDVSAFQNGIDANQVELSLFRAELSLVESIYNNHIIYEEGINLDNNATDLIGQYKILLESLNLIDIDLDHYNNNPGESGTFLVDYSILRNMEDFIYTNSDLYYSSSKKAFKLKNFSSDKEENMYNHYLNNMDLFTEYTIEYAQYSYNIIQNFFV